MRYQWLDEYLLQKRGVFKKKFRTSVSERVKNWKGVPKDAL